MSVTEAVRSRRSVRAYTSRPVSAEAVRATFRQAAQAPSGGNLQPWVARLVEGNSLDKIKCLMRRRCSEEPNGETPTDALLPEDLPSEAYHRHKKRFRHLSGMFDDPAGEKAFLYEHFQFFGAPVGVFIFIDRRFGPRQWLDVGLYMQTAILLLREAGLDCCTIGSWAMFEPTVLGFFNLPPSLALVSGIAVGHRDPYAPINAITTERDDPFGPVAS